MLFNNTESDTSLSREDGGEFDFLAIDLAKSQYPQSGPIRFLGYRGKRRGGQRNPSTCDGQLVSNISPAVSAFVKLTEVRWAQQPPRHQFDNVQVRQNGGAGPGP